MKGDYFVNRDCIGCEACVDVVPQHFGMKNDRAYITKQPKNKAERDQCLEAREICPVEAIKRRTK